MPNPYTATVTLRFPVSAENEDDAREQVDQRFPLAAAIAITPDTYSETTANDELGRRVRFSNTGFDVSEAMLSDKSARFVTLICMGLCCALFFAAKSCHGATVVTEEFLDRLAWRESRNNPAAVGQVGELGAYQLRACAVEHVNNKKGWKSDHKKAALKEGRKYARAYCMSLESELGRWIGRPLVQSEVDHAYQLGPTGFLRKLKAGQFQSSSK